MSSKQFYPFKDFQSDQIQKSSRKIFTVHYACGNADLNLTQVTETTNGFIFQIINSLIESWGVGLTCFDCNKFETFGASHHVMVVEGRGVVKCLRHFWYLAGFQLFIKNRSVRKLIQTCLYYFNILRDRSLFMLRVGGGEDWKKEGGSRLFQTG